MFWRCFTRRLGCRARNIRRGSATSHCGSPRCCTHNGANCVLRERVRGVVAGGKVGCRKAAFFVFRGGRLVTGREGGVSRSAGAARNSFLAGDSGGMAGGWMEGRAARPAPRERLRCPGTAGQAAEWAGANAGAGVERGMGMSFRDDYKCAGAGNVWIRGVEKQPRLCVGAVCLGDGRRAGQRRGNGCRKGVAKGENAPVPGAKEREV